MSRYIVAVDIGGTFSDLVCLDRETGEIRNAKIPSTPPTFIDGRPLLCRTRGRIERPGDRDYIRMLSDVR